MQINFKNLADDLIKNNLMSKPLKEMSKEEIELLCRTILANAELTGEDDVPF